MSNIEQYKILHSKDSTYGVTGGAYIDEVCLFIDFLKPKTVLDYGCGKGALIKELSQRYQNIEFYGYDPAIPGRDKLPVEKADFVINTDVLEHIPEDELPLLIKEISQISQNVFFVLHHYPAEQILPNGENAHCTVKPPSWYYELLGRYFKDIVALESRSSFTSVVLTFKLLPEWIHKYNSLIEPYNLQNDIQRIQNELREQQDIFKILHKNDLNLLLFKYRFLRLISFGRKKQHYKQKVIMLKDIKKRLAW